MVSNRSSIVGVVLGLTVAFSQASCSGGEAKADSSDISSAEAAGAAPTSETPEAGASSSEAAEDSSAPIVSADTITPALIAEGKKVYEGASGAICATCHGQNAKGVPGIGPDLTDGKWLHGDGSFEFLKRIVKEGVMQPKESPSVMPPYGGVPFDDQRLAAVAAYIHSLNPPTK
ncbi:MAG TPA: c-type cytochrome [Gemmatimonadales bacterium]|nr:c-type cytochrome [Gemmatimonadales bacterium]